MEKISVIGFGSWGTALAIHLNSIGNDVTLYGRDEDGFQEVSVTRRHPLLNYIDIPEGIKLTNDLESAVKNEILLLAVPSPYVRDMITKIYGITTDKKYIINVAKGVEIKSGKRLSEVIEEVTQGTYVEASLTGPTHAEEVAKGYPAAIVVACLDQEFALRVQKFFSNNKLRVYINNDLKGAEWGGTLKNIIAIGAGIVDGLGFGDNAKAALITRGLKEISDFGLAMGSKLETFLGLTGIGDLMVTCNSVHSRNRSFGELLGQGLNVDEIYTKINMVVEGVYAVEGVTKIAKSKNINMPITFELYEIIFNNKDINQSFNDLMNRELKGE